MADCPGGRGARLVGQTCKVMGKWVLGGRPCRQGPGGEGDATTLDGNTLRIDSVVMRNAAKPLPSRGSIATRGLRPPIGAGITTQGSIRVTVAVAAPPFPSEMV